MQGRVYAEIGKVTETPCLYVNGLNEEGAIEASLNTLLKHWKRTLSSGD
jgi:hypothetical protein